MLIIEPSTPFQLCDFGENENMLWLKKLDVSSKAIIFASGY